MPGNLGKKDIWVRKINAEEVLALRAKVLRPHHPLGDCVFEGDHALGAAHFGAGTDANEILAVGTIYPEAFPADLTEAPIFTSAGLEGSQVWRLRGMATADGARGLGLGAKVLEACVDHVRSKSDALIWAHARTGALEFYERHGFRSLGQEYILPGVGPHYVIIQVVRQSVRKPG